MYTNQPAELTSHSLFESFMARFSYRLFSRPFVTGRLILGDRQRQSACSPALVRAYGYIHLSHTETDQQVFRTHRPCSNLISFARNRITPFRSAVGQPRIIGETIFDQQRTTCVRVARHRLFKSETCLRFSTLLYDAVTPQIMPCIYVSDRRI